jgi:hypothetical protein
MPYFGEIRKFEFKDFFGFCQGFLFIFNVDFDKNHQKMKTSWLSN